MEFEAGAVQPVESVEEGWRLIKNDYWLFFGMTLVFVFIVLTLSFALNFVVGIITGVISAALGAASQNAGDAGKVSAALVPQLVSMVLGIFTGLITATLSGILTCGVYTAMSRKANGETPEFGDLFAGMQYFQQCFVFSLILSLINFALGLVVLLIGAVFGVSAFGAGLLARDGKFDPNILGAVAGVAIIIGLIYLIFALIIGICTTFTYPLITERKLSAIGALGLSARAGFSNFFGLFGLFIVQTLIALLGLIACGIGLLFVIPVLSASIFAAYLRVFGRTPPAGQYMPPPPPIFANQQNF